MLVVVGDGSYVGTVIVVVVALVVALVAAEAVAAAAAVEVAVAVAVAAVVVVIVHFHHGFLPHELLVAFVVLVLVYASVPWLLLLP